MRNAAQRAQRAQRAQCRVEVLQYQYSISRNARNAAQRAQKYYNVSTSFCARSARKSSTMLAFRFARTTRATLRNEIIKIPVKVAVETSFEALVETLTSVSKIALS